MSLWPHRRLRRQERYHGNSSLILRCSVSTSHLNCAIFLHSWEYDVVWWRSFEVVAVDAKRYSVTGISPYDLPKYQDELWFGGKSSKHPTSFHRREGVKSLWLYTGSGRSEILSTNFLGGKIGRIGGMPWKGNHDKPWLTRLDYYIPSSLSLQHPIWYWTKESLKVPFMCVLCTYTSLQFRSERNDVHHPMKNFTAITIDLLAPCTIFETVHPLPSKFATSYLLRCAFLAFWTCFLFSLFSFFSLPDSYLHKICECTNTTLQQPCLHLMKMSKIVILYHCSIGFAQSEKTFDCWPTALQVEHTKHIYIYIYIYQISGHNFLVPSLRRSQNFLWPVELTEISVPNIFKYMHIFEVGHKIFEVRSQYYNTAIK